MSILIVTGTVSPPEGLNATVLMDPSERERQYIVSLKWFIEESDFYKIVFCENSNAALDLSALEILAQEHGKLFEYISFEGDVEKIRKCGKGYGEGQIIDYALDHSKLVEGEDYFYKITGRIIIKNINEILHRGHNKRAFILCKWSWMHTWFYGMPIQIYEKNFREIYKKTDDSTINVMEALFFPMLYKGKFFWDHGGVYPEIYGTSGSSGKRYEDMMVKWKEKMIHNKIECVIIRISQGIRRRIRRLVFHDVKE